MAASPPLNYLNCLNTLNPPPRERRPRGTDAARPSAHPQASGNCRRSCRLEPVDAFADEIELQSVLAGFGGRGNLDRHVSRPSRAEIDRQARARGIAPDPGAPVIGQACAERNE